MSKQTRELFERLKEDPKTMGAIEAAVEGIKEAVQAIAPGLTLNNILHDVGAEMKRLGVQGQMEVSAALFNGSAFVPYGPGQWKGPGREGSPEHGLPDEAQHQPEREQGREM